MIHPRVSVHGVCFGTDDMDALFARFASVGAAGISLSSGQVLAHDPARVRALINAGGHHAETMTHLLVPGPLPLDAAGQAAARDDLDRAMAAAATVGAKSLYLLTGGRGRLHWEEAADIFAAIVAPQAVKARAGGVMLAVENGSPLYADLHIGNTLRDTIALAELADIGLCLDMHACWTEGGLRGLIDRAAPRIAVVQASDHVPGDRALPCRAVPGDGAIDWPAMVGWLDQVGYKGAYDLELIGPRIVAEGVEAAVTRAAAFLETLLDGGTDGVR